MSISTVDDRDNLREDIESEMFELDELIAIYQASKEEIAVKRNALNLGD